MIKFFIWNRDFNLKKCKTRIQWLFIGIITGFLGQNCTKSKTDNAIHKATWFKILPRAPIIEMVKVKGGTFQMGNNVGDSSERPAHEVTLDDFAIGKYEVTQAQWQAVMGTNPAQFNNCQNCPVENVSWEAAQVFIQALDSLTGKNYRLPTEAEWEFAARGGPLSKHFRYSGSNNVYEVAWFYDNSGSKTHVVGEKWANELGIYDMSGNVSEWCGDWYHRYDSVAVRNPTGALRGLKRVRRGGAWWDDSLYSRLTNRRRNTAPYHWYFIGFRLAE
ncbi:MAG: hypothetical protein RLZZ628_3895 [Bacteroidota bacterium]|jgi:formylglycine-generating enzyme required for sulfatase activity